MTLAEKLARTNIINLTPYSSARNEGGNSDLVWIDANEGAYAPFPSDGSTEGFNRYPDPQPPELINRMASFYGVKSNQILASRGTDEAIDLLMRAFCVPDEDSVLFSIPTFDMYEVASNVNAVKPLSIPLNPEDFSLDMEALRKKCKEDQKIKLVFVCSPNNPTANSVKKEEILELCDILSDRALVIVDEAYIEFSECDSLVTELANYKNLAILRTMSKAFCMAGVRMGALIANDDIVSMVRKVLAVYPLTIPSINASVKALSPAGILWMKDKVEISIAERTRVSEALSCHCDVVKIYPSDANFILVEAKDVEKFIAACAKAGFLVRNRHKLVPNTVRVTIGSPEENTLLLKGLGLDAKSERHERTATVNRSTKETDISVSVNLDRADVLDISTGIGFYDHMLEQLGKHGKIGIVLHCKGDTHIDDHHSVEDCAIALGQAIKKALGDKRGINRYGFVVPMDEAQANVVLDLSGRSALRFEGDFPTEKVGELATEMIPHFFQSLADNLEANIHVKVDGENSHHMAEGCFKAFARALRQAISKSGDEMPSTKGIL